jgi:hypothetical protein
VPELVGVLVTPELWALEALAAVGTGLIVFALWPDVAPRAERHPGRQPEHAQWTMHSPTAPLAGCSCPVLLLQGVPVAPAKHYAGCSWAPPGDRRR